MLILLTNTIQIIVTNRRGPESISEKIVDDQRPKWELSFFRKGVFAFSLFSCLFLLYLVRWKENRDVDCVGIMQAMN